MRLQYTLLPFLVVLSLCLVLGHEVRAQSTVADIQKLAEEFPETGSEVTVTRSSTVTAFVTQITLALGLANVALSDTETVRYVRAPENLPGGTAHGRDLLVECALRLSEAAFIALHVPSAPDKYTFAFDKLTIYPHDAEGWPRRVIANCVLVAAVQP